MGIKKLKLPTNILQPEEDLGLSGLMRLGRTVTEEGEDLSFLNEKSALMSIQQDDVFDVKALVEESIRSIALVPKDLKYDDSSMPQAPNFLEWCEGREFLNAKPYLEQALAGILLFAEYCPHDSDMDWVMDIEQHDPLLGTQSIRDHMTLTNFGVCPKCGKTRLDHFESGDLNFYNELVLLWGQRCVTGDTHVLTSNGIERIGNIGKNKPFGFSTYNQPVYNGKEFETTSDFYRGKAERVYALKLRNGYVLRGTGDHPVMTYTNFKRLANITGKDLVPVYVGQNVWGNKQIYHSDLADAARSSFLVKKDTTRNPHLVKSASFKATNTAMCADFFKVLGYWVAEGRGNFISNTDQGVLEFCHATLTKYINARYVERQPNGIYLKGHTALAYLAAALGLDNESTYSGSEAKCIPDSVLQSTKENVCSFISGLFEGDGTVDHGDGRIKGRVSLTTISKTLAYDVYAVLTNLGILPRIRQRKTWATNGTAKQISKNSWEVSFAGTKFLSIFQENIGFASIRKSDRLSKVIARTTSGNDVPYFFDNYSFLKGELKAALSTVGSELSEFVLPYTAFTNPEANKKSKSARSMTLHTILRGFNEQFGFKIHKMLGGSKALTRTRLRYIADALLGYSNYLSDITVSRIRRMRDLVADNVYLLEVKDCTLTDNVCETYDFTLPDTHQFITQGVLSHNSGKSEVTAMLTSYQTHRVLKMQNPTKIYGIGSNQILQGTFVALTQSQAMENLWTPYYGYLTGSPWFKKYHELMAYYDAKYGLEMVKVRDTFVLYKHRSLLVYPASPDLRVLRGRCVTGGTIINTNSGFLHFDELVKSDGYLKSVGMLVDSPRGIRSVSHTYKDRSPTVKLTTRNGYSIEGTHEHPMLVITKNLNLKWKRLDSISVGDWIVSTTSKNSPMYGTTCIRPELATILGYMVANGYRNEVSSDDPKVISNLSRCYTELTGLDLVSVSGTDGVRSATHRLNSGLTSSKGAKNDFVTKYLKPTGFKATLSARKEIPVGIRTASLPILHEFLESYFECDSGINGGGKNAPWEIEVGSASKKLAHQLHVILLHSYGIVGRMTKCVRYDRLDPKTGRFDAQRKYWLITITGHDAYTFLRSFARAKVQKYKDRFRDVPAGYASDRRSVPYIRTYIWNLYKNSTVGNPKELKMQMEDGSVVSRYRQPIPAMVKHMRPHHARLADYPAPEFLAYGDTANALDFISRISSRAAGKIERILDLGAHFEEVISIGHGSKPKNVYDITVPEGHAFTANGLTSHNTRLWGAMDELGWMDNNAATASKKVKANATGTYQALSNSLQTVRAEEQRLIAAGMVDCLSGYMYNISSPSSIRDKICELYRLSQGSKKMLGIQAPTWKINPKFSRATLDEDFRKDPIAAERDFGANPPLSSAPFINDFSIITDAMKEKGKNFVNYKHQVFVAHDLEKTKTRYASILGCKESTINSVLALDAGETNNSFAMSVMSKQGGIISIDCLIDIMPLPGIPLNYTLIYNEIILPICKMRNVKIVVSDRWNSTKILQDLYDTLVIAKYQKYSLKYEDMWNFKSRLEQRSVQIPRSALLNSVEDLRGFDVSEYPRCFENRPVEHFMFQCVTVQDSGRQVIKGPDMTDDLWRATVLGCWALENPDFSYYLKEEIKSQQSRDPRRLAVSRAGSGYSSGAGMEGGSKVGRVGAVRRKRGGFDS